MAIATNSYRPTLKGIKKEPTVKERSRNSRHLRISVKNNEYLLEQIRLPIPQRRSTTSQMICPRSDSESEFHAIDKSSAMDIEEASPSVVENNLNSIEDDLKRQLEEMRRLLEEKEVEKKLELEQKEREKQLELEQKEREKQQLEKEKQLELEYKEKELALQRQMHEDELFIEKLAAEQKEREKQLELEQKEREKQQLEFEISASNLRAVADMGEKSALRKQNSELR